jgi:hypothetical protein
VNVNPGAGSGGRTCIGYDGLRVYGSPSYHAIKMFSAHIGDQILKATPTGTHVLVSATRDSRAGTIYVKLVNAADTEAPVQLDITGVRTLASTGTAVTLAADSEGHQLDRRRAGSRAGDIEGVRRQARFHLQGPGARHYRVDPGGALSRHVGGTGGTRCARNGSSSRRSGSRGRGPCAEVGNQVPRPSALIPRVISAPATRG